MNQKMTEGSSLFERVVEILEQARSNVVRSVNTNMAEGFRRQIYGISGSSTLSMMIGRQCSTRQVENSANILMGFMHNCHGRITGH